MPSDVYDMRIDEIERAYGARCDFVNSILKAVFGSDEPEPTQSKKSIVQQFAALAQPRKSKPK